MKEFLIFVLLFAICSQGDARKVCILFEQETVTISPIVNNEESVTITEEKSDVQEDIVITLGEQLDVTDVVSVASEDAVSADAVTEENLTEKLPAVVTEAISVASNAAISKSTNICALEGITLFDDQNDLLRKICTIKPGSSSLYVITVQNSVVQSDLPLATLCAEGPKGLLSWISWQDFIEKVKPFLGTDELPQLVVRNSSIGGPSESESVDPFSEVLIEMLPIRYRLVNMKPSAWNNNTFIKTVSLGNIELENSNDTEQHIEGELNYSFPIETNTTFLSNYPINGLPVEMSDERKNFIVGTTTAYLFKDTFSVERLVPAFKKEIVSLNGTFGIHEYDIEGKIISIFGVNSDGSSIEESHFISARVVSSETYDIKESHYLEDYTATTTEEAKSTTFEELPIAIPHVNGPVYPGFKKFFYVAVFLVFATFFIAMVDIARKLLKDRKARASGRRTYQKIIPKF